jgi:hypothetical protein
VCVCATACACERTQVEHGRLASLRWMNRCVIYYWEVNVPFLECSVSKRSVAILRDSPVYAYGIDDTPDEQTNLGWQRYESLLFTHTWFLFSIFAGPPPAFDEGRVPGLEVSLGIFQLQIYREGRQSNGTSATSDVGQWAPITSITHPLLTFVVSSIHRNRFDRDAQLAWVS